MSAWILAILLAIAPPGRTPARETAEAGSIRYAKIAADVVAVVEDPSELPLFGGPLARERTAILIAAVSFHESGWRLDVDNGTTRGGGTDVCLMQLRVAGQTAEGWTANDLASDRQKCIRAGLHLLRRSMSACRASPLDDQLGAYTSGKCSHGLAESRAMMAMAKRWFSRHPPPKEHQ